MEWVVFAVPQVGPLQVPRELFPAREDHNRQRVQEAGSDHEELRVGEHASRGVVLIAVLLRSGRNHPLVRVAEAVLVQHDAPSELAAVPPLAEMDSAGEGDGRPCRVGEDDEVPLWDGAGGAVPPVEMHGHVSTVVPHESQEVRLSWMRTPCRGGGELQHQRQGHSQEGGHCGDLFDTDRPKINTLMTSPFLWDAIFSVFDR
jgi:hypothetical protein